MDQQTVGTFTSRITGEVILPDSTAYNDLRSIYNQTGSPAIIVRVKTADDIAQAIRFARDHHLKLSVRSDGHGMNGLATNDGGLVIDLAHFNTVEVIDSTNYVVRVGAGAKWGDVAKTLANYDLAISSGDSTTVGVGGLTLGGGIGWLVRKHGLTIDSLQAAHLVTADGRQLRVSANEHPDLFWAIRGGGGNFGVATSFEFRAQPLKSIIGGMVIFPMDELASVLRNWAQVMRTAPEELNSTLVIFPGFGPEVPPQLFVYLCYGSDDETAANEVIKPLLELGTVQHQDIQKKPYDHMLEDPQAPPGMKAVSESGFIRTLDEAAMSAIVANFGRPGTPILQIRSLGGVMKRIDPDSTAFAHRDHEVVLWTAKLGPIDAWQQTNNLLQRSWQAVTAFIDGAYINFLSTNDESRVTTAYAPSTYARLARVKAVYDPDNIFNQNYNIKPAVEAIADQTI
jgi:hypothetical protein